MKTLVVMPARNEARGIGSVLDRTIELYPDLKILVVNDHSSDATSKIARSRRRVSVIDLPYWIGYGGALQTAYKYALRNGYESVLQLDADGQHDPIYIAALLQNLERADVVIGSRFLDAGSRYRMLPARRIGCYILSWVAQLLTGMKITDPTSGFQALSRKALEIAIADHYPLDYPDIDVLIMMHRYKLKVVEVPVIMHAAENKHGMHEGLQVWYYGMKMLLSVFVMMLRKA
jgi:glycosyltransferase involved in cell wall biosynthesis